MRTRMKVMTLVTIVLGIGLTHTMAPTQRHNTAEAWAQAPADKVLPKGATAQARFDKPADQEKRITADAAWQRLKDGNERFVADKLETVKNLSNKQLAPLVEKQQPVAAVLSCADSRVIPEFLFDAGLGKLFTLRVAGNVGDPDIYASLEYALAKLNTPLIVVLGHESCGAVDAAVEGKEQPSDNLKHLIGLIDIGDKLSADKKAILDAAVRANVVHQARKLTRESTILKDFVVNGRVKIVAGVFSLETGKVTWLEVPGK